MFATIKSWLRPTPPATAVRPRLGLQQLEAREVPAALLDLSGNLTVTGTAVNDHMYLTHVGRSLTVMLNETRDTIRKEIRLSNGTIGIQNLVSVSASSVRSIRMNGLAGNDTISASAAPVGVTIDGGEGNDFVSGSPFRDTLLTGEGSSNTAYGNGGNDTIYGGSGADILFGGLGDDVLFGSSGNDWMYGDAGLDSLFGGIGIDNLNGGDGNDRLLGERDNDTLRGGFGDDTLDGGAQNDILYGEGGDDTLNGDGGHDRLYGGTGKDILSGGAGHDGLFGGAGVNLLTGGTGADRFLTWDGGNDTIADQAGEDAKVPFQNTSSPTTLLGNTYAAANWAEADVIRVDDALHNLHVHLGNTKLLKLSGERPTPGFRAVGAPSVPTGVGGVNGNGLITIVNPPGHGANFAELIYHEIGHNWDDEGENRHIPTFRAISGWVAFPTNTTGLTQAIVNRDWWFRTGAAFAGGYGQADPLEDFATAFAKYFMERYHVGPGGWGPTPIPEKFGNLELLFADLRS